MKNMYGVDQKLNLEELFTNDEIKTLKKSFPKINILIMSYSTNDNSNQNLTESSKDKIFIYKRHYYKLISDNLKNKYEQEGNNIMVKSLSCMIDDYFSENNNFETSINNSNSTLNFNNDNKKEIIFLNKKKQKSNISLADKKINELRNEILQSNNDKSNKNNKDDKIYLKNNNEYIKKLKLKSPINNYKNIYYYNIINSKKIINNNNYKNEPLSKNKKFVIKNDRPLYSFNHSLYMKNNTINKLNTSSNFSYFNRNNINHLNYNNYSSSIQSHTQTEQNKNINKNNLNKKRKINESTSNGIIDCYNYINIEKKKRESHNKNSNKDITLKEKSVKSLGKNISFTKSQEKNKTPIQIRNVKIYTDTGIESLINTKKNNIFTNIDVNSFNNIENQNYNIFELTKNVGRENILPIIGYSIFTRLAFSNISTYHKLENWCRKIAEGYKKENPYHTDLHAADITHTCLIYLKVGKVNKICKLSKNSKCALFLSCICHDYKHPGVNNNFLKETRDRIAIKYNDISILENMHIAEAFKLINNPNNEYNIFQNIDNNTYKQFRKEMISCVLSTDMTFHNIYIDFLKRKRCEINNSKESYNSDATDEKKKNDDYQNYMNVLIHSADISNPTKPFEIYFQWAELVVKEFYAQGDKEKKLNMPCSCDRNKVTIYQSQLGFINFIEIAYFSLFVQVFENLSFYLDNLNNNKNILLSMQEKEKEKEKEKGKEKENEKKGEVKKIEK